MAGIEASSTIQVIAALIASALYVATYLSFVHLLRFPRNWCPISLPESLTTGILAALTVALVSLLPDALDRPALAIMVAFFGVVSYIIAAPAIVASMRPGNTLLVPVEIGTSGASGQRFAICRLVPSPPSTTSTPQPSCRIASAAAGVSRG